MELNKIKQRLELALRPAEEPTIEEVLEQVSTRGVLRGPVDWVFPAWTIYVEYATQRIIETFQLSEEERRQLLHFRDTLKRLLLEAQRQAKAKLTALYKAVVEGTYKAEGSRLYAPDEVWIYISGATPHLVIRDVNAETYFPDLLKFPRERLELFQLGWRASDEGMMSGRPVMNTAQPWQVFAWAAMRCGKLRIRVDSVNLTREGVSALIHIIARSWRQRWSKDEAIDLVASRFKSGEWAPLLTMWLGDGMADRGRVLRNKYQLIVVAKEPWRLSSSISGKRAYVTTGREAFEKLKEAAGAYGALLDLLRSHKWIEIKLATDDVFRTAYRLKTKKRNIDRLREAYGHNNGEIPTEQFSRAGKQRRGAVVVAGIIMHLHLVGRGSGSLYARRYVRDVGRALAIADKLKAAGLRPNVARAGLKYLVYITMTDLLKLAEKDEAIRWAIAQFLAEKAKNGTPRQKEIAEKILKRNPLFTSASFYFLNTVH
jgi:hypothetical protein